MSIVLPDGVQRDPASARWRDVLGRPFVVVTPNGPSDGGDYGPNTPGTVTGGIQEAINAADAAGGISVEILPGTYDLTGQVTAPANGHINIRGHGFSLPVGAGLARPATGVILACKTAGSHAIYVDKQLKSFSVDGISIDLSAEGAATGHGIFFDAATYVGTLASTAPFSEIVMAMGFSIRNVYVYGTDAGHYGFVFANIVVGCTENLFAGGLGGFYEWTAINPTGSTTVSHMGNCRMRGYNQAQVTSGAPTVNIVAYTSDGTGYTAVNYVDMDMLDVQLTANLTTNFIYADTYSLGNRIGKLAVADLGAFTAPIDLVSLGMEVNPLGGDWPGNVTFPSQQPFVRIAGSVSMSGPFPTIQGAAGKTVQVTNSDLGLTYQQAIGAAVAAAATTLTVALPHAEADTNYKVFVALGWNSTWWITGKTTTEFVVNFGTSPAAASTLDWQLLR